MTTVTVYRSTDTGAPSLTGQAGALVTVLDAVLVNGYNSNNPAGAGWAKSFSGTNKAVYRNSAVDGTGSYLNVDDSAVTTAKEAYMTGATGASGVGTLTGQFPTSSQLNIGTSPAGALVCRKSTTADSTARAWTIVADDTVFYLFAETGDQTNPFATFPFVFGDIFSYKASDANRCIIIGRNAANISSGNSEPLAALLNTTAGLSGTIIGHYMAATWTGVGGSIIVGKHVDQYKLGGNINAAGTGISGATAFVNGVSYSAAIGRAITPNLPYPNGPDGGLYLSPIWIHHTGCLRGYLKGLWSPLHDRPLNHNDTYSGTGNLSGKSFLSQAILSWANTTVSVSDAAQIHVETSSTWS
jgi:hypothetical protein